MLQKNWTELIKPSKMEVNVEESSGRHGKLTAEPLERGFGLTLGNSIRRILLSSLQGAAITSVKIKGVVHEFSTIAGVKEDLTDAPDVAEAEEDEAEDDTEESEDEAEEADGDEDLKDLSVDQFKDMIRDIIAQEIGHSDAPADDMDAGDIEGMGDEPAAEEPEMAADEEEIDDENRQFGIRPEEALSRLDKLKAQMSEIESGIKSVSMISGRME